MLGYSLSSSIFTDCWHDFGQIVKLRHRGIGYDAVKTVMKYAFEELQLHRLESSIIASQERIAYTSHDVTSLQVNKVAAHNSALFEFA
jgi:hypothetical protein